MTRIHTGPPEPPSAICVDALPSDCRVCMANPFAAPGVVKIDTWRAPAPVPVRIMIPALVHWLTFSTLFTCAVITKLPASDEYMYWNSSAVPQMSAPLPRTVYVRPSNVLLPAAWTVPMSADGTGLEPEARMATCDEMEIHRDPSEKVVISRTESLSLIGPVCCHTHSCTLAGRPEHSGIVSNTGPPLIEY